MTTRILMWSGPRNLSTAMMRAFGARGDCDVVDEPFYGVYLKQTGLDHPMRDAIIADMETDPVKVAHACRVPKTDKPLHYQKHMVHHMIDGVPTDFMAGAKNVFLIRQPERVLASYVQKREAVTLDDIGLRHQVALFEQFRKSGSTPPIVVDSDRITADPAGQLSKLCQALEIPYTDKMLSWEAGIHPTDGIWASHWYNAVESSTGLVPREPAPLPALPPELEAIAAEARTLYEQMAKFAL